MAALLDLRMPGVYTQEIPTLPSSVAVIQSAVPVFIGYTQKASRRGEDLALKPTRIKSLLEYEEWFGGQAVSGDIEVTVDETETNPRRPEVIVTSFKSPQYKMHESLQLYFTNGGGPCYIISVGAHTDAKPVKEKLISGVTAAIKARDVTILAFPEGTGLDADDSITNYTDVLTKALTQCEKVKNRVTLIDVPDNFLMNEIEAKFQDKMPVDIDLKKYGMAYYPFLETSISYVYDPAKVKVTKHIPSKAGGAEPLKDKTLLILAGTKTEKGENDLVGQKISEALQSYPVKLPPSSAIAGIYVRTDALQGVWKAPANVSVFGVIKPSLEIDDDDHATLNAPSNGKAINVIRAFPGRGLLVYGARTLAANSLEWRYVNVRRTFCFIEDSVARAMQDFVFEPNNQQTWIKVTAMIKAFLNRLWKAGGLYGNTPEDAYDVQCEEPVTMSIDDVLNGIMIVVIKVAVARPAEFIVLRYEHKFEVTE